MLIYISGSFKIVNRSRATYWLVLLDHFHMTRPKFYLYKYFLEDLKFQTIHNDKKIAAFHCTQIPFEIFYFRLFVYLQ